MKTGPDQSHRCPHEESMGQWLPTDGIAMTLIRLDACPGISWLRSLHAHIVVFVMPRLFSLYTDVLPLLKIFQTLHRAI